MKILIISPPRAGSTSLLYSLGELLNCNVLFEPYINPLSKRTYKEESPYPLVLEDDYIVKMISYQVPKSYGGPEDFVKFILSVYKEYDKVILLGRLHLKEHFESFVNLMLSINTPKRHSFKPWFINDIANHLDKYDIEVLKDHINVINKLSKELKIPITYYEDLYGLNREKSLEIIKGLSLNIDNVKLNKLLDPSNRLRQTQKQRDLL